MAKRKRQQKRQLTVGKLLAALLALWAVGAGLWFHYDFPLPEPLAEEITTVEKLAEEKLPGPGAGTGGHYCRGDAPLSQPSPAEHRWPGNLFGERCPGRYHYRIRQPKEAEQ